MSCQLKIAIEKGNFLDGVYEYDRRVRIGDAEIHFTAEDEGKLRDDFQPTDKFFEMFCTWYEKIQKKSGLTLPIKVTLEDQYIEISFVNLMSIINNSIDSVEKILNFVQYRIDVDELIDGFIDESKKIGIKIGLFDEVQDSHGRATISAVWIG
jgi:hypothetical protein